MTREEAKELLQVTKAIILVTVYNQTAEEALDMAIEALSADVVEVKHGKWLPIVKGERGYSAGDFRCSECRKPNKCYSITDYCPNCGAKMY